MYLFFSNNYHHLRNNIIEVFKNFKNEGTLIGSTKRNSIKFFMINGVNINFKSFAQPNFINRIVYKYFRKSKAKRSFEYAHLLISKSFYTPQPIAYMETYNFFGLTSSFYISEHLEGSISLREVFNDSFYVDREKIIKEYSKLAFQLHENGIEFIDNTAGNFLIKKENNLYKIFLVDLNRMNFYNNMKISKRLKNLSKITANKEIIKIISDEYSALAGLPKECCLEKIINYTKKRRFKRDLKNKLKFYKRINTKNNEH